MHTHIKLLLQVTTQKLNVFAHNITYIHSAAFTVICTIQWTLIGTLYLTVSELLCSQNFALVYDI